MEDVTLLFDKVIEAAANRDARVAQIEEEHARRVDALAEEKHELVRQLQAKDEEIRRVNGAKFSLIRAAGLEAEAQGAAVNDEPPF